MAIESLRRWYCAFRGHDEYLHFEKNRVYLHCVACGHESPGWTVEPGDRQARGFQAPVATRRSALVSKIA